jgi:hypothetical protein
MRFVRVDNGSLDHPSSSAKIRNLNYRFLIDYCTGKDFELLSAEEIKETLGKYDPWMYANSTHLVHDIRFYSARELRYILDVRLRDAKRKVGSNSK